MYICRRERQRERDEIKSILDSFDKKNPLHSFELLSLRFFSIRSFVYSFFFCLLCSSPSSSVFRSIFAIISLHRLQFLCAYFICGFWCCICAYFDSCIQMSLNSKQSCIRSFSCMKLFFFRRRRYRLKENHRMYKIKLVIYKK